jgi:hypothetical protein
MFSVHCSQHGAEVLLGPGNIERVINGAGRIEVRWRCHCGHRGTRSTGRARASL